MKKCLSLFFAAAIAVCMCVTAAAEDPVVHVGSLKGPTTIGLVTLMTKSEAGEAEGNYSFDIVTQADVLAAGFVSGTYDIILIPANAASILNKKTNGGAVALSINTLGVLYCVTGAEGVTSVKDLAGKTVITTGQGTTPEYALRYLLAANDITDCALDFRAEATEIAAILANNPTQIAVLPQPFATVAQVKNPAVKAVFSLSDEWAAVSPASAMVTGVTLVRRAFVEENPDAVATFLKEQAASVEAVNADAAAAAELVVKYGIIEKASIAQKALPLCNIVCITGDELKAKLSGYLSVLFEEAPTSVGGQLPGDDFYFTPAAE